MNIKSATLVPKKELEDKIVTQLFKGKQEDEYWTAFPDMDARTISFSDGTTITVSKNYVFLDEREAQVFADEMVEGTEIVSKATGEKIKVTSVTDTKTTLYGFYSKTRREDSLCGLMEKLAVRRDYWHIKNGKEMVLNWSFTPFTAKNSTPFQFAGCMAGLSNKKTLTPAVEKARQLGMKFRVGTSSDVSTLAQVLTLGDRRLNKVIYRAYKEKAVDYYGGMGCLSGDTLVRTEEGYKPLSSITLGEVLYSSEEPVYVKDISERTVDHYYKINMQSAVPILSSEEHPFLVRDKGFVPASKLKKGDLLVFDIAKKEIQPSDIILPYRQNQFKPYEERRLPFGKEFAQFIALYLSDGSLSTARVNIVSGEKCLKHGFRDILESVSAWFNANGISVVKRKAVSRSKSPVLEYRFNSTALHNWVKENLGEQALHKRVPSSILMAPAALKEAFLNAYSDGYYSLKGTRVYSSCNRNLITSIFDIGAQLGRTFRFISAKNGMSDNLCYVLEEIPQSPTSAINDGNMYYARVTSVTEIHTSLKVYNLTSSSSTYSVPFIVHNCGSDSVEKFAKILKEETGHDYKVYGEEKWLNQVMPWDFIDIGMTKEHLKERYLLARSNMNSPFGCFVRCVQCGACNVSQNDLPQEITRDVSSEFTTID